jgi:hypothetical protein
LIAASGSVVLGFEDQAWKPLPSVDGRITGVFGRWPTALWVVADTAVWQWNGQSWKRVEIGGRAQAVAGSGPDDVWVLRENDLALRFQGGAQVGVPVASPQRLELSFADGRGTWLIGTTFWTPPLGDEPARPSPELHFFSH